MRQSWDCVRTNQLEFEAWAAVLRSTCGGVPKVKEPDAFAGWMRRLSVHRVTAAALKIHYGFAASDHGRRPSNWRTSLYEVIRRWGASCFGPKRRNLRDRPRSSRYIAIYGARRGVRPADHETAIEKGAAT
jgi:hypothetical protein